MPGLARAKGVAIVPLSLIQNMSDVALVCSQRLAVCVHITATNDVDFQRPVGTEILSCCIDAVLDELKLFAFHVVSRASIVVRVAIVFESLCPQRPHVVRHVAIGATAALISFTAAVVGIVKLLVEVIVRGVVAKRVLKVRGVRVPVVREVLHFLERLFEPLHQPHQSLALLPHGLLIFIEPRCHGRGSPFAPHLEVEQLRLDTLELLHQALEAGGSLLPGGG
mmetsp:Transcript_34842/g.84275  ORF Transcript_34842/g.84275 Transcript_34842/m.84275 type:complete len:223 (-) Transcript_34842:33-701(-)